jgi:hypothetical protein
MELIDKAVIGLFESGKCLVIPAQLITTLGFIFSNKSMNL